MPPINQGILLGVPTDRTEVLQQGSAEKLTDEWVASLSTLPMSNFSGTRQFEASMASLSLLQDSEREQMRLALTLSYAVNGRAGCQSGMRINSNRIKKYNFASKCTARAPLTLPRVFT